MIGAIDFSILMQKAITGDTNNEFDIWGDLYKANLRTNGNGFVEYEAFINGPGIYKLTLQSGKLKIVRMFFVGGQGKSQYPVELDGNLPILIEKTNFSIGETAEIFIPNPFNNPAKLLFTLEREHVIFQEVIEIKESFLIYKLPIIEDHYPNVFISILMIDEINASQISGITQININSEHKQLSIEIEIEDDFNLGENSGIIDFSVNGCGVS